ncbi:MAG: nucleotidyltransferase family protein, partial [Bacteroidota bacterium]
MKGPIGCIVLAAGASTRMGQAKQLLPWEGKSLIRRAVETALASKAKFCVTVLGARSGEIAREIEGLATQVVYNSCWEKGMASSLKAGLLAAQQSYPCLKATLVMLVDQPYVRPHHLNQLIETYQKQEAWIVASSYEDIQGVPA